MFSYIVLSLCLLNAIVYLCTSMTLTYGDARQVRQKE